MGNYYKHYIKIDGNNRIIKGFSDAFETPLESDICLDNEGGRHFELNGQVNPPLVDINGCHLYKFIDGEVVGIANEEIGIELANIPKIVSDADLQIEYLLDLDFRLSIMELGV